MRLKSTVWALAFACAAVSCSDDLEGGPNTENGNGEKGEGVYMTINISSAGNPLTKAVDPTGGESGDGYIPGTAVETEVHDVNIYLIGATSTITAKDGSLNLVNGEAATKIAGRGYSSDIQSTTGSVTNHTASAVLIKTDDVPTTKKIYHVLAVTNLGAEKEFTTLGALRDFLQATAWTGEGKPGTATKFIMSTHQMYDTAGGSSVEISSANTDANNPAKTTVYVERLAARVDFQFDPALWNGTAEVTNPVIIEGSTATSGDFIKLTNFDVINRWKGNTYMLKRVTQDVTGAADDPWAAMPTTISPSYLGDETWLGATTYKYNYVVDPQTTEKKEANVATLKASYDLPYSADLNTVTLHTPTTAEITAFTSAMTPYVYTRENTLDLDNQIYGLTTAAVFKGEYTPSMVSTYSVTDGTAKVEAKPYTAKSDFYVVNDFMNSKGSRYLCKDLKTIGVLAFEKIKTQTWSSALIIGLFDDDAKIMTDVTLDNLKTAVAGMVGGELCAAYKKYLNDILNPATGTAPAAIDETLIAKMKWSLFLTTMDIKDPASETTNYATVSKSLYDTYKISYYKGGTCYYHYWIRHATNDDDQVVGPMEFCIVRNNVYQLKVNSVSALGDPLPFLKPETTPDEEKDVFINVQVYVKHWVQRVQDVIL